MTVGSIVKFNPKWCTPEELKLTFVIVEEYDHRDDKDIHAMRYRIRRTSKVGVFYHEEVVDEEMVEDTGVNIS